VTETDILAMFHQRLQASGLKSTRQRDIIVATFFALDEHISVDELLVETRKKSPRIGYATVYRTLKLLVEQGFASPRHFGDGQTRYDPQIEPGQHDHIICTDCRRIIEFQDPDLVAGIEAMARAHQMSVTRRRLEIYASCQRENCEYRKA
jgi:Fur family ferric uptake transcriptional regulator